MIKKSNFKIFQTNCPTRALLTKDFLTFGYHQILKKTSYAGWKTDEDEFGISAVELKTLNMKSWKLPIKFSIRNSGGDGEKRDFALEAIYKNKIIFSIRSPFYDSRGWGGDNYVLSFDLKFKKWLFFTKNKKWKEITDKRESSLFSFGSGEIIVWKDKKLNIVQDYSLYHSETAEISRKILSALNKQRKSQKEQKEIQIGNLREILSRKFRHKKIILGSAYQSGKKLAVFFSMKDKSYLLMSEK